MNLVKKLITSEWFFVFAVCFLALFISFYPSLYEIVNSYKMFPDRYFILVHNFAPDYHAYLSKIIQGLQGHWLAREYFTSEPHQGSLLQIFYVFLGEIGRVFNFTAEEVYHCARIVFGLGWLLMGWLFIKFSFVNKLYRKIAFLLFVFMGNWPKVVADPNGYGFSFLGQKWETTMVGWSNLDIVKRITFVPHWSAGHILTVVSLLLFIKFLQDSNLFFEPFDFARGKLREKSETDSSRYARTIISRYKFLLLSGFFGLLAGFVLPPTLIIVYAILGLWFSLEIIRWVLSNNRPHSFPLLAGEGIRGGIRGVRLFIIGFLIYIFISFPSLLYNVWVTQFYPWKALVETDLYVNRIIFPYWNYLVGLGPTAFLGILGIPLVLLFKKEKIAWSAYWVLGMFALILVFDKLLFWHDQTRFIEVGPELPLAVLSVVTLTSFSQIFGKFKNIIFYFLVLLLFVPSVFLMAISVRAQTDFIDQKLGANYPSLSFGNYVVYPTKEFMEGVAFLAKNTTEKDVILSGPTSGNHIAAYAGRVVYIGHGSQTARYYQEKLPNTVKFYSGNMTDAEARKFIKANRITSVFFGPEEKLWSDWVRKKTFLELVYINGEVRIYRVK